MPLALLTGIGVASSAGLNAYIPLLVLAIADHARDGALLGQPYDFLSSLWGIVILMILLTIELIVDKSPLYRANDVFQSMVRPAAGALAFMASASNTSFSPVAALILGLAFAVFVHATKAGFRQRLAPRTRNVFMPALSMLEDAYAAIVASLSIAVPVVGAILVLPLVGVAGWTLSRSPIVQESSDDARSRSEASGSRTADRNTGTTAAVPEDARTRTTTTLESNREAAHSAPDSAGHGGRAMAATSVAPGSITPRGASDTREQQR